MRKIYYLFALIAVSALTFFANCGGNEPTPLTDAEKRAEELTGTWSQSTTEELPSGVDPTILDDLSVTFNTDDRTPTSVSISGAPEFFTTTSSSTWSFSGGNVNNITLTDVGDGVSSFTISGFSTSQMTISFTYTTPAGRLEGNERILGLDGNYVVVMTK